MPGTSSVLRSISRALLFSLALFSGGALQAEQWYSSNNSSQAIAPLSATMAKRASWALSIETVEPSLLKSPSPSLSAALLEGSRIERQALWKEGSLYSTRWAVYERSGRLHYSELHREGHGSSELYSAEGRLLEETLEAWVGKKVIIRYRYNGDSLVSASCFEPLETPEGPTETSLWVDRYFYTRSGSLRLVQRTASGEESSGQFFRLHRSLGIPLSLETWSRGSLSISSRFDPLGREIERTFFSEDGTMVKSVEKFNYDETDAGKGSFRERLEEAGAASFVEREYDSRGRVLREIRLDSAGEVLSETRNEWVGGNLAAVTAVSEAGTARLEYEYDGKGTITVEKNYFNGELERVISRRGDLETEDLFLHGSLVLRAVWQGSEKKSEERFPLSRKARYAE